MDWNRMCNLFVNPSWLCHTGDETCKPDMKLTGHSRMEFVLVRVFSCKDPFSYII